MSSPYSFYGQKGAMNDYFSLTEMFFFIVFLLYLSENNAQDEEIVDCATGAPPRRPTIPPEFCQDLIPDTCSALFVKEAASYTDNLNPYVYFSRKNIIYSSSFPFKMTQFYRSDTIITIYVSYILARTHIKSAKNAIMLPSLR